MGKRNLLTLIGSSCGLLVLILDGQTAIRGMRGGIELCLYTLIPSLFPFCVLSVLITGSIQGRSIRILSPIGRLCRIPAGWESLYAVGLLGGYPVGAQNAATAYRQGNLSRLDASRLAIICNNAGPAFLFGVLGSMFDNQLYVWALWIIQILSSLILGMLLPGEPDKARMPSEKEGPALTDAIRIAAGSMVSVCSCVILFRMILEFLSGWFLWHLPDVVQIIISGILELSNGCILLSKIYDQSFRFIVASGILSFGGICVWMQTLSICKGINIRRYLPWKLLQAGISVSISVLTTGLLKGKLSTLYLLISAIPLSACWVLLYKRKKGVAF